MFNLVYNASSNTYSTILNETSSASGLVVADYPLFGDPEVSIGILADDRALTEILSLARSTMIGAFPANNVPILMMLISLKVVAVVI